MTDERLCIRDEDKERTFFEQVRYDYDNKIEFYGLKGNSKEFDEEVEKLASIMRKFKFSPDFEKAVKRINERNDDKPKNTNKELEMVLVEKYSNTREVIVNREKGEPLLESLKKIYNEKEIRDPNLNYALNHYTELGKTDEDKLAKDYVFAFIKSLSTNEKIALMPKDKEDAKTLIYSDKELLYEKDRLFRPIYGYCFLNEKMVDTLAEALQDKKCADLGCGNGMLSKLLQDRGVDVTPVDLNNEKNNSYDTLRMNKPATDIVYMDSRDYLKNTDEKLDVVILSWPPANDPIAADIVKILKENSPDTKILYIGEDLYGATADDEFFNITTYSNEEPLSKLIDNVDIEHISYYTINDHIVLLEPNFEEDDIKGDFYE